MDSQRELLLFGAGGHASATFELATRAGWKVVGVYSDSGESKVQGLPVYSNFAEVSQLACRNFAVAIGDNFSRFIWVKKIRDFFPDGFFPTIVDPSAIVSSSSQLAEGASVFQNVTVGPGADVGRFVILNTKSDVQHDAYIGDFGHLAPSSSLAGGANLGERSFLGAHACVREKTSVGKDSVVGASSYVASDIADQVVAFGVPAKTIRTRNPDEKFLR